MENNISKEVFKILNEAKNISATYPDKAYTMSKEAYHLSKKNNLKLEEGDALICMALACRAKSEINKLLDYSFNAFVIFEELHETLGQIKALNLIGIAYFYNSMYEQALKYLLQALDLFNGLEDNHLLSCMLNNIGEVFRESCKYDRALEYYDRALKVCTNINSKINIASLLNNIGEIYFAQNKNKQALEYFTKSYDILIEENEMVILGDVENKIGKVYYTKENYNKAAEYFFSAIKRLDNINNKFYAIDVLVNIGKLEMKKNSPEAYDYFEKAIEYAEKTNAKKKLSMVYKIIADFYEKTGDFRYSLEYFKKYHLIEQEITTSIIGNKLEILKIELDYLKEERKFEKIKMINQRLEMEISNGRNELKKIQKLNKSLEKKALEDQLTGVPNRSYINSHLKKTWQECLLYDQAISLFIIDIDNFKKYNDYWGHLEGDKCLKKVASSLKDIAVRRKDVFGRWGGEEFFYYAKDINYDQAFELGNLLKNEVEKLCLKYMLDDKNSVVTISLGGALGKVSNLNNISNMIEIADKELYRAKNMGRNTIFLNSLI